MIFPLNFYLKKIRNFLDNHPIIKVVELNYRGQNEEVIDNIDDF